MRNRAATIGRAIFAPFRAVSRVARSTWLFCSLQTRAAIAGAPLKVNGDLRAALFIAMIMSWLAGLDAFHSTSLLESAVSGAANVAIFVGMLVFVLRGYRISLRARFAILYFFCITYSLICLVGQLAFGVQQLIAFAVIMGLYFHIASVISRMDREGRFAGAPQNTSIVAFIA
jgi:hypothetical protein